MRVLTNTPLRAVSGDGKAQGVVTDAGTLPADIVILAIGIKPATKFLENSGIELVKGAVAVDEFMRTSLPDVYAAGDCALVKNAITGERQWSAMGSTANITARALAKTLTGTPTPYGGCLGTGVVRLLPTLNAGRTGLTLQQAKNAGFDAVSALFVTDDKAHYYPNSSSFVVKIIADKASHRLLGLQVLGAGAVDKMIDIAVGGCPNNCVKPDLNDLGIIGQSAPEIDLAKCRNCKVCQIEKGCPIHTAVMKNGKISIDEAVLDLVERAILFFRDEGISGERFADTVARLGFDCVEDKLLNSQIDKSEILKKNVVGGATC